MSSCHLDGVNMCCWTHGCDIDEADYTEGTCAEGAAEDEMEAHEEDYIEGQRWDEPTAPTVIEVCDKCRGSGSMATNPKDPANNPPVQVCNKCGGKGVPAEKVEHE